MILPVTMGNGEQVHLARAVSYVFEGNMENALDEIEKTI